MMGLARENLFRTTLIVAALALAALLLAGPSLTAPPATHAQSVSEPTITPDRTSVTIDTGTGSTNVFVFANSGSASRKALGCSPYGSGSRTFSGLTENTTYAWFTLNATQNYCSFDLGYSTLNSLSSARGTFTTLATPTNRAPVVSATGQPSTVNTGGTVTLDGTASDPDGGDTLTYSWTSNRGGTFADPAALDTTWTAPNTSGAVTLTLSVTDSATPALTTTATVTVAVNNRAPTASATAVPTNVNTGGTVTLDGTASDPDGGDTLTYAWTSNRGGAFADPAALDTTWTAPNTSGAVTLTLTVTDSATPSGRVTTSVTVMVTNRAPVVSATGQPSTVSPGDIVTLDGTASDPDGGDSLTYAWTSSGGGMFANAAALDTTWTAPNTSGAVTLTLTVTDSAAPSDTSRATVSVTVQANAPRATITPNPAGDVNTGATVTLTAVTQRWSLSRSEYRNCGAQCTYAWTSNRGGAFADATDKDTTWTAPNTSGAVTLTLTVTDRNNRMGTETVTVTVTNRVPTVSATVSPPSITTGGTVTLDGTASDPDGGDTLTYAWTSNRGGVFADPAALDTTWTAPNTSGAVTLTLSVTDSATPAGTVTTSAAVTVTNRVPVVSATGQPSTVNTGGTVTLDGTASDPDGGDTLTYAWTSNRGGAFADPAALDTTWTAPNTSGAVTLTLSVTDSATPSGRVTTSVTVMVTNRVPTVSATVSPPSITTGGTVTLDGTASDPDGGDTLTYAWTSNRGGAFADPAALDTTWTAPNTSGAVTLTLSVTDSATPAGSAMTTVTVTVRANRAPIVSATGTPTEVNLGGTVTLDGTASDPDTGDTLTYAWTSDEEGAFADATALDTTWTAPNTPRTVTLTLTVTDSGTPTASATTQVTITVADIPPTVAITHPGQAILPGQTLTLEATVGAYQSGALTYQWTSSAGGAFSDPEQTTTQWTAPLSLTVIDAVSFTFTVTTQGGGQASSTITVGSEVWIARIPIEVHNNGGAGHTDTLYALNGPTGRLGAAGLLEDNTSIVIKRANGSTLPALTGLSSDSSALTPTPWVVRTDIPASATSTIYAELVKGDGQAFPLWPERSAASFTIPSNLLASGGYSTIRVQVEVSTASASNATIINQGSSWSITYNPTSGMVTASGTSGTALAAPWDGSLTTWVFEYENPTTARLYKGATRQALQVVAALAGSDRMTLTRAAADVTIGQNLNSTIDEVQIGGFGANPDVYLAFETPDITLSRSSEDNSDIFTSVIRNRGTSEGSVSWTFTLARSDLPVLADVHTVIGSIRFGGLTQALFGFEDTEQASDPLGDVDFTQLINDDDAPVETEDTFGIIASLRAAGLDSGNPEAWWLVLATAVAVSLSAMLSRLWDNLWATAAVGLACYASVTTLTSSLGWWVPAWYAIWAIAAVLVYQRGKST